MKYFTPELFVRLQSSDADTADKADEEWEGALMRYRRRLDRIRSDLPRAARHLAFDLQLHDAEVLSMARENGRFVSVLRLSTPPARTVILTYRLAGEAKIDRAALPSPYRSSEANWLYDEVDVVSGKKVYRHFILLSNGWQLELHFRELSIFEADALLPSAHEVADSSAMQPA